MDVVIGEVSGHPVGTEYDSRKDSRPIHPYTVQGIHGDGLNGAGSIVLNGGYAEDKDFGDVLLYTGEGLGRDQTLTDPGNAGLVHSIVTITLAALSQDDPDLRARDRKPR